MEHFFDWSREQLDPGRPWLILGKGPSFGARVQFDLTGHDLLSLNHAVREQPVRLAHMIDLDVVMDCADVLESHAEWVVLPWYPHVGNRPGRLALPELLAESPVLRRMDRQGRLLWYDLGTGSRRHGPGPVVHANYFSAEAAVALLGIAGVRRIRSLGVDGGAGYSGDFEDLAGRTLLANGQPGFDLQFRGIARTILRTGVDFAPLDLPSPVVVHIVGSGGTLLPDRVLEFSVRKHTSISVQVHLCRSPGDLEQSLKGSADDSGLGRNAAYRRAIVLRSGALVLDDLRKLWVRPRERDLVEVPPGRPTAGPDGAPDVAVVTTVASHFSEVLRAVAEAPGAMERREDRPAFVESLPAAWNRRDRMDEGATALLRYEVAGLQPWISRSHPLAHLWVDTLLEAVREGFVSLEELRREVRLGHVRPSLLEQVERDDPESLFISWSARQRDAAFTPHGGPQPIRRALLSDPRLVLGALARHARRRVRAHRRRYAARRG